VAGLFIFFIHLSCKNLTPVDASRSAAEDTRTLISKHVSDEVKAKRLIEIVDRLESDLETFNEKQIAHNKTLAMENANYDVSEQKMRELYNALNRDTEAIYRAITKAHFDMKALATEEEWKFISKPKDRIGGY
jgi:hypothetical protein